jgi:hypothetical protein
MCLKWASPYLCWDEDEMATHSFLRVKELVLTTGKIKKLHHDLLSIFIIKILPENNWREALDEEGERSYVYRGLQCTLQDARINFWKSRNQAPSRGISYCFIESSLIALSSASFPRAVRWLFVFFQAQALGYYDRRIETWKFAFMFLPLFYGIICHLEKSGK